MRILAMILFALFSVPVKAQDNLQAIPVSPPTTVSQQDMVKLQQKYCKLAGSVQQQTCTILASIQRQEVKLQRILYSRDSAAATQLFAGTTGQYAALKDKLTSPVDLTDKNPLAEYFPGLDSMNTALGFLQQTNVFVGSPDKLKQIQGASQQITSFETRLQQANQAQAFIQQREKLLTAAFEKQGLASKVISLKKQAFYYGQRVAGYKQALQEPDKLSGKALTMVSTLPAFKTFMQHHSYLSSLFRMPTEVDTANGTPLPGLQTKASVAVLIEERRGKGFDIRSNIPAPASADNNGSIPEESPGLQNPLEQGKALLGQWQDKVNHAGGGNSNMAIPDFQANNQHNKTFLQRLEVGFDLQSQQSTVLTPAMSTLGLNIGYKLDDRHLVGFGGAYKLGLGQPFNHIALSSQGASVRSFFNWRLKGSLWLAGGYEANYLNAFDRVQVLLPLSSWQQSGLIGLQKSYKTGGRSANMQLFYDLLYKQHIPQSQPLVFRLGYSLK